MFQTHKPTELRFDVRNGVRGAEGDLPVSWSHSICRNESRNFEKKKIISGVITKGAVPNIGTQLQSKEKH